MAPGAHDDVANACAGALLRAFDRHKHRVLSGFYMPGGGSITWHDAQTGEVIEPERHSGLVRDANGVLHLRGDNSCWPTEKVRRRNHGVRGLY